MELVLDLHLHSRFSRAVSPRMTMPNMYVWGRKKGLNVLSIADFTHPVWFREAQAQLEESADGIYKLKREKEIEEQLGLPIRENDPGMHFMLSTEVSLIYAQKNLEGERKQYRTHNLIFAPNFEVATKINQEFASRGFNLTSDGRPIFGISARALAELLFSIDKKIVVIPCHIWTPWYSLYGSKAGFDRIADCFGEYAKYIFAIETGLSSDPSMNWRVNELSTRSIVSFSDAHSLEKMGREATVLRIKNHESRIKQKDITYSNIMNALIRGKEKTFKLSYTIEFYPEEGKYHYSGHRNCGIVQTPEETRKNGEICPVCKKELTVGVMHRVEELANTKPQNFIEEKDHYGAVWIKDKEGKRPPYVNLVPLLEILAEALNSAVSSQAVMTVYDELVATFGSEHEVLLRASIEKIQSLAGITIAEGIEKVRARSINIAPGYDNTYGIVKIWSEDPKKAVSQEKKDQLGFKF